MTILDSSVWIALFNESDSQYRKANELFDKIQPPLIIPEYVFIEVCTILTQKVGKSTADLFISIALENQNAQVLVIDEEFFYHLIEFYQSLDGKHLSFIDSVLLRLSRTYNVITFDEKLKRAIIEQKS